MTSKPRPPRRARPRPSHAVAKFVSPSFQAWSEALRNANFRADLEEGLEDTKAGRTRPWTEIRRHTPSS
ncbi:MAG: hypothetical protein WEE67_00115 [Chloroflexota bacterium]